MRRLGTWLLASLAALLIVLPAALSTHAGQSGLLRLVSLASGNVQITNLTGSLFGEGSIATVRLTDDHGVWLEAHGVSFEWMPWELLSGRLAVNHLRVGHVDVLRRPISATDAAARGDAPAFALPLKVALGELDVKAITLAESVVGERLTLRVTAAARIDGVSAANEARFEVRRLNGSEGHLKGWFTFKPDKRSLDVAIEGGEPEGGTVSRLLGLPERTPVTLHISGMGTLDAWKADLSIAARGEPFLAGTVRLDAAGNDTHRLSAQMAGFMDRIVPEVVAPIFSGRTDVSILADLAGLSDGAPRRVSDVRVGVNGYAVQASATGGFDLARGALHGVIDARIARPDGDVVGLNSGDGHEIKLREFALHIVAPEQQGARQVVATARATGLDAGIFAADALTVAGRAVHGDPSSAVTDTLRDIRVSVSASGIDQNRKLGKVIGADPSATLTGDLDEGRLTIHALDLQTATAKAHLAGHADRDSIGGKVRISVPDLSPYSEFIERPLQGNVTLDAVINGRPDGAAFVASLSGKSTGLSIGVAQLDGLLMPSTTYQARLERVAGGGLSVSDAVIANERLNGKLDAKLAGAVPIGTARLLVSSLEAVSPNLKGGAELTAEVSEAFDGFVSRVRVTGRDVMLNGKPLDNPSLDFSGRGPPARHQGVIRLGGRIGGEVLGGRAQLQLSDAGRVDIQDLVLEAAGSKLDGDMTFGGSAAPSGHVKLDAQNLARLGHALGIQLSGGVRGDLALSGEGRDSQANINLSANHLVLGGTRVATLRASGRVADYLKAPVGTIEATISGIARGEKQIGGLSVQAKLDGRAASVTANGKIDNGTLQISANARATDAAHQITLSSASYVERRDLPPVRLAAPAGLLIGSGKVSTKGVRIGIGKGTLQIEGAAGAEEIDAKITLDQLPMSIASVALPELGLEGTLRGTVHLGGKLSSPQVHAKVAASGVSTADSRSSQMPPASITADIATIDGKARIDVKGTARGGLGVALTGSAELNENGALALVGQGDVPLGLANVLLADRATQIGGRAKIRVDVSGRVNAPRVEGTVTVDGATVRDAELGLELKDVAADIRFTQDQAVVQRLVASSRKGGSVSAEGTMRLGSQDGPALDAVIKLASFKFGNQDPVAGTVDGDMTISGPLHALVARGGVLIERMDITVPNSLPRSVAALDIRHVNAPAGFQPGARNGSRPQAPPSTEAYGISLAIDVTAHDRIFIRGRGVDAQLGGMVRVRGTTLQPFTDGRFTMSRGKLAILGRQLDFNRGVIAFVGSTEPSLDLEAQADADGTRVTVKVTGPASNPKLTFTSSPELPEDEVVALLLFNKKLAKLSAAQLIQLAGEIDKIGGLSSGPGTLDKMKSALGVDVLDVTTDEKGNAQATAGSYVSDKTYVGVKQGMTLGTSRIVVDHDLTKNLKARGEVGTDGDSKLGLGFEFDY